MELRGIPSTWKEDLPRKDNVVPRVGSSSLCLSQPGQLFIRPCMYLPVHGAFL